MNDNKELKDEEKENENLEQEKKENSENNKKESKKETKEDKKKVTLDKVLDVLENDTNEVFVDEELAQCALKPLNKMLELAAK